MHSSMQMKIHCQQIQNIHSQENKEIAKVPKVIHLTH